MHDHSGGGEAVVIVALFAPLLFAGLLYLAGAVLEGRRGRSWPWMRTLAWLAGLAIIGLGVALPSSRGVSGARRQECSHCRSWRQA